MSESTRTISHETDVRRRALERTALEIVQRASAHEGDTCLYCRGTRSTRPLKDDTPFGKQLRVEERPIEHTPDCPAAKLKAALGR